MPKLKLSSANTASVLTPGTGADGGVTHRTLITRNASLVHTQILVDIDDLVSAATTDLDIIGESGAANAHIGQVTAALNGTIFAGRMTCLEAPDAGVCDDIDLYGSSDATGTQGADASALTAAAAIVTSGAVWTTGRSLGLTNLPTANHYLYLANGASDTGGTYTTGKFLIEFWGTP